jgi:formylglycine-generating enzyme required for sulfatase activity
MNDGICPVCGYPCVETAQRCSVCGWDLSPVLVGSPEEYEARLVAPRSAWREKIARGEAWAFGAVAGKGPATFVAPAMEEYTNGIGMVFVLIPAGTFMMGETDRNKCCRPVHQVTISRPFYLGKYLVTQEEWQIVMGYNPSKFKEPRRPVERVSWEETQVFIGRLNQGEGQARYRLPTEAEWEYACRAGSTGGYCFGNFVSRLDDYAWYGKNSGAETGVDATWQSGHGKASPGAETHPVGERTPNIWGLYDMHGNVWEWVQDWFDVYPKKSVTDPAGPSSGDVHLLRGGSYESNYHSDLRSARRQLCMKEWYQGDACGFRLAFSPQVIHEQGNPERHGA